MAATTTTQENENATDAKRVPLLFLLRSMTPWDWLALSLCTAALLIYSHLRARGVGGCDSFAYLADSLTLRGVDSGLGGGLDPEEYPAVVPLCHVSLDRHVVSLFLPGFPALLALFGLAGLETHLNPFIGALSVALVYVAARDKAPAPFALLLAVAWSVCPIVVWGAARMMSDLPAATALLGAHVLLERRRGAWSGAAVALAIAIRPASLLMGPVLFLVALARGCSRRFVAAMALGLAIVAAFLAGRFGSPFAAAYGRNLAELSFEHFAPQLAFLGLEALRVLTPIALLAVWGALRAGRAGIALCLWSFVFFAFHALWRHPFHEWWWLRFALSSLPAWMVLAAWGSGAILRRAQTMKARRRRLVQAGLLAMLVGTVVLGLWHSMQRGLHMPGFDKGYRDDAMTVAELIPSDALVGALNFGGPLRLYVGLETFDYTHPQGLDLAERSLRQGRPVYLVAEPWLLDSNPKARRLIQSMRFRKVAHLSQWRGLLLLELGLPGSQTTPLRVRLDLGREAARPALRSGWSHNERDGKRTFVWATGKSSSVNLRLEPGRRYTLSYRAAPFGGLAQQCVAIQVDEVLLENLCLDELERTYELDRAFSPERPETTVRFTFSDAASPASLGLSRDERQLAAAFDWIEARPTQ
ncbi:MAG: hypothetical protein MUC50_24010 [Myxococcota bacterium]|jgi:hypothetical protein|nr:hypothetical protein [Myxococcota bacterium]